MRILVAVDGSEQGYAALRYGLRLAKRGTPAVLDVLIVALPVLQAQHLEGEDESVGLELPRIRQTVEGILAAEGVEAHILERRSVDPAETICRTARDGGFDNVIMGRWGRSAERVAGHYLGSVAYRVLQTCPCPVTVV